MGEARGLYVWGSRDRGCKVQLQSVQMWNLLMATQREPSVKEGNELRGV